MQTFLEGVEGFKVFLLVEVNAGLADDGGNIFGGLVENVVEVVDSVFQISLGEEHDAYER